MSDEQISRRNMLAGSLLAGSGLLAASAMTNAQTLPSITIVNTFSSLATTAATLGQVVFIKGHTLDGIGSGIFEAVSGSVTSDGGTQINSATSGLYWKRQYIQLSAQDFGANPDGVVDSTAAIQAAINSRLPFKFTKGTYKYTSLTGLDVDNISITGDGSNCTFLQCTGSGVALTLGTTAAFRKGINLSGFTVLGNPNITEIIVMNALCHSQWTDINVAEANSTTGRGFVLRGCSLNDFKDLTCSQDWQYMASPPAEAVNIEALSPFGNSSNNTFTNLYAEGGGAVPSTIDIGIRMSGGDQNTFISGSAESCGVWGLLIGAQCKYNTFIGVAFENLNATGGDFADGGKYTQYINCYGSQNCVLQGKSAKISGGIYERIEIQSGALKNIIENISINNWSTGAGGFIDNGTDTIWKALWDADASAFIYPFKDRIGLSLPASGVPYTNSTGTVLRIVVNGGNLTGVSIKRNAHSYNAPFQATVGEWILAPNDIITISYSASPTLFWGIPMNGFDA